MAALSRSEVFTRMARGRHRRGYKRPVPVRDNGTPELQAKRLAIVGHKVDPKTGQRTQRDTHKAAFPLDAMLERGYIDQDQYSAGRRYGWLYSAVYGDKLPTSDGGGVGNGLPCGEAVECPSCRDCSARKIALAWRKAHLAIPDCRAKDALENVSVYHRFPRWYVVEGGRLLVLRGSDVANRKALLRALDALVKAGVVMREKVAA